MADPAVPLEIASSRGPYPVWIRPGALTESWALLGPQLEGRRVVIVTQRRLRRLYGAALTRSWPKGSAPLWLEVPQGEQAKSIPWLQRLTTIMARESIDRSAVLVALGGGVVGDLAGFVAASYMRGIAWVARDKIDRFQKLYTLGAHYTDE